MYNKNFSFSLKAYNLYTLLILKLCARYIYTQIHSAFRHFDTWALWQY